MSDVVSPGCENRKQCLKVSCMKYLDVTTVSSSFMFTEGGNLSLLGFEALTCRANPPPVY